MVQSVRLAEEDLVRCVINWGGRFMPKLHRYDFFYGAILNTILSRNPDACPTLIELNEEKSVYKITTNSSEKDMIIFCKYASNKDNKSDKYKSWLFAFSDSEKECINKYHDNNFPVLIFFLCMEPTLYSSEIVICTYKEFSDVSYKKAVTIGKEKNKKYYLLYADTKERKDAIHIKSNRVEMYLNQILPAYESRLKENTKSQLPQITLKTTDNGVNVKKRYEYLNLGQEIKWVSLNNGAENICPVHKIKMPPLYVHFDKVSDIVFYCKRCGRVFVTQEHLESIQKMMKNSRYKVEVEEL